MTDRISEEVVSIVEVEYEPQMDRAKIQGTLKMDDGKWKFRTKLDHIKPGDVLRVIVERTEDEDGKYLRIHEIIEERKQRYV